MRPITNPSAGSPSIAGTTGTLRGGPVLSIAIAIVAGTTCVTSTPKGTRSLPAECMSNSRR